ncbi:MAG TPA: cytochrome P450 [Allosphingosinicella sp.]|nr:cytochrome P450 [Allosphingosinicella sp.]
MTDAAGYIVPPAPPIHPKPLSSLRLIMATLRNPLTGYSEESFQLASGRVRMLGQTMIGVNHPDGVKHVLTTHAAKYQRPVVVARTSRWMMGEGLFLAEGEAWRKQRRMLAPLFSPAHTGELLPHFLAAGRSSLARLRGRREAKLSIEFNEATLDAVLRALFSTPADTIGREIARLTRFYLEGPGRPSFFDIIARREEDFALLAAPRRRFRDGWHRAVDALVSRRQEEPGAQESRDLLGILLEARDPETGTGLSAEEVRDQAATMLFAGFETTTRLLSWAAYLLALDQREQALVREEVAAFPPERIGSLQDLQNWPRLKCVLLEALRLYPPVPQLARQAVEADEVLGERVEPGDLIWIAPWALHRHRDHWEQPTAFMPQRFHGQAQPWMHGAFIPFGGGPRICIGASFAMAEAQILMATLLNTYRIDLIDQRPVLPVGLITTVPSYEPRFSLN